MALYKHGQHLRKSDALVFDAGVSAGTKAAHSGIYRCTRCGCEIAAIAGTALPHHAHSGEEEAEWQLIVYATAKP
jgi:hypothetical protein